MRKWASILNFAHSPIEIGADQENRANQNRGAAPKCGNGAAVQEIIQVCLMAVRNDQQAKDQEAERQADQAYSRRDLLQFLCVERLVGRFALQRSFLRELEVEIVSSVHRPICWFH